MTDIRTMKRRAQQRQSANSPVKMEREDIT
jgi:hypothetical protein